MMNEETIDRLVQITKSSPEIKTVDVTGGAPELNQHFKKLVSEMRKIGKHVIVRTNLSVFFEPHCADIPEFLKDHQVEIVASMPCYLEQNVDRQRGRGTYNKSIKALKLLNSLGYGMENSDLVLNLVYNPGGPSLPPSQEKLEADYKKYLRNDFDISFTHLLTITNLTINRFKDKLLQENKLTKYESLLMDNFNCDAAKKVMCKNLISISWEGLIFDCDFNQALGLYTTGEKVSIWDIENFSNLKNSDILFEDHCFGCTAGAGSSCSGSLL
jgi:radical SAM/Cys-rich protein